MERNFKHPLNRQKPRWPGAAPGMDSPARTRSNSSASGDSLSKLVRRVSRSWGGKATGLFRRNENMHGSSESRASTSLTIDRPIGPDAVYSPSGSSFIESGGIIQDHISVPPAVHSREPHGSVKFSSFPSRSSTIGTKSIGEVFKSCRRRLSINSLAEHHGGTGRSVSAATAYSTSPYPPRVGLIEHLDSDTGVDTFQADLQEAMRRISARDKTSDSIENRGPRSLPGAYASMPVRGKGSAFNRAAGALRELQAQPCNRPGVHDLFKPPTERDHDRLSKRTVGGDSKLGYPGHEEGESQDTVLKQVQRELTKLSPTTAMIADQLQPASLEGHMTATTNHVAQLRETVKLVYPWIQQTKGRMEVCPTHEAAMAMVSLGYETDPVHDLAFYDRETGTYFLQPACFLLDRENEALAKSRGLELVSLTRRAEVMKLAGSTDLKMVGALKVYGPSVLMVMDEDFVVISIRRGQGDDVPVIVEDVGIENRPPPEVTVTVEETDG